MNDRTQTLLNLIKENPDLPIVPMVDYEVVPEDYGRWMGSFGYAYVGEYALLNERFYDERIDFIEDYYNYNDEYLNEQFNYDPCMTFPNSEGKYTKEQIEQNEINSEALDDYLEEVADKYFKKAIIVNIDLPEEKEL